MIIFSISGELDKTVAASFRPIRSDIVKRLNEQLGDKNYGDGIRKIFLAPIIRTSDSPLNWPERRLFKRRTKTVDYRTEIEYEVWMKGDDQQRKRLVIENLLGAIVDVQRKCTGEFDGASLCDEIRNLFGLRVGNDPS